jgi:hypothetical protein
LQTDDFVIAGKDVFAPETRLVVVGFVGVRVGKSLRGCLHVCSRAYFSFPNSTYLAIQMTK